MRFMRKFLGPDTQDLGDWGRGHRFMKRFGFGRGGFEGGGFEGFQGFKEHRRRGRASQFFESGDLLILLLHFISETPRHGYEIIKLIEAELSGLYAPSPGTIYPALTMLEEMGFANVTAEGARKLYTITDAGLAELESNRVRLDAALERLRNIGQTNARERPTPILRAMENLKLVLRMRSDSLTQKQIIEISDIIDAAGKQIERL